MASLPIGGRIRGEVLLDPESRETYSLAECIYRVPPLGVVLPSCREDVLEILEFARREAIPLTARGAGSAVAGQTLGSGLIVDFSRHLNRILEINPEERWARVEPGVILADLNRALQPYRFRFAPDPASAAFCTLGGMIANNAGGARSVRYGATRDHVLSLTVVTAEGEILETSPLSRDQIEANGSHRPERLARALSRIVDPRRVLIDRTAPMVRRMSSGYELLRAVGEDRIDLTPLLVGSEGTLALTLEATLRLTPLPGATGTALLPFLDLESMGEGVLVALRHAPSALEALDRSFLDLIREAGSDEVKEIPAETEVVLILEIEAMDSADVSAGLDRLERDLVQGGLAEGMVRGIEEETSRRIWEIRKAASPILSMRAKKLRSTRFIEDACVPTARLPRFLAEIRRLMAEHRLSAAIFGHAGDALLHVNPLIDPLDPQTVKKMERVAGDYTEMVLSLGGALSGEHGDGRLRTPFLARAFGEAAEVFREVKGLFDPQGILNPGIKVHDGRSRMSDHLDLGPRPTPRGVPAW